MSPLFDLDWRRCDISPRNQPGARTKGRRLMPTSQPKDKYPKPQTEAGFKGPVRWLLGPQLIASLKWTVLYASFKGKLDPRDWMRAQPISLGENRFNSAE